MFDVINSFSTAEAVPATSATVQPIAIIRAAADTENREAPASSTEAIETEVTIITDMIRRTSRMPQKSRQFREKYTRIIISILDLTRFLSKTTTDPPQITCTTRILKRNHHNLLNSASLLNLQVPSQISGSSRPAPGTTCPI